MGNILEVNDVIKIIYNLADNDNCTIVCKQFYNIISNNSTICYDCHKFVKIFDKVQWITDKNDSFCHGGYYKTLEEYTMIKQLIFTYPDFFSKIDKQCYAICDYAIKQHPYTIKYIKNPTETMCLEVIQKHGLLLQHINHQTKELCNEAINNNPFAIEYVLDKYCTEELCLKAVMKNGLSLEFIPEHKQTKQICIEALKNDIDAFEFVSGQYQTDNMCMDVLKINPKMINYIVNPKEEYYVELYKLSLLDFENLFPKHNNSNNAFGCSSLSNNTTGSHNTAIGHLSMINNAYGNNNISIGSNAGSKIRQSNNIMVGNSGLISDSNVIRIGQNQRKNYQSGIFGTILNKESVPVYISSDGQLGTIKF